MRTEIRSSELTVQIDSHGAELKSVVRNGKEYMWQADPAYWNRTSPVLFPFVGAVSGGKYRWKGQEYPMGQHGFARDCEFELVESSENKAVFRLDSSEETLAKYPFAFSLEIAYTAEGSSLTVEWRTINKAPETLWYAIGAHPAFNVPVAADGTLSGVLLGLGGKEEKVLTVRDFADPLAAPTTHTLQTDACGFFALDGHTFDGGALIFENDQLQQVSLADKEGSRFVTVDFTSPLVGVWSPVGKNAPFVCIEPWYGRADMTGFAGELNEREFEQSLEPGGESTVSYRMTFA